jgi:hypothetical protein
LNSTPQLLARERRVVARGAQLGPGDLRLPRPQSGASDNVFAANDFSERDDAICDEFRMLDELRWVAGNSRDQDLPGGSFTSRQTLYSCS